MKKNFTRLASVGMACFCMLSAMGQERMPAVRMVEEKILLKNKVELRAGERQQPDSVVQYLDAGYKANVLYYANEGPEVYYYETYECWCISVDHFYVSLLFDMEYDAKYNSRGLVESLTSFDDDGDGTRMQFQYNANGYLLSADYSYRPVGSTQWEQTGKDIYSYDEYENWVGLQGYFVKDGVLKPYDSRYSARTDSKGRIVYSDSNGRGAMSIGGQRKEFKFMYYIWHYSDGRTPNVAAENSAPVGSDNKGGFDLDVNVPVDSISNGTITVAFPEGFTLDEKNTSLTLDFAADFTLKITKQENNSWLLEILPKTTRSASLRAGDAKRMLHAAYAVDKGVAKGTYDIVMDSIVFNTPGGNIIPEPAITVPVVLNRESVANERIETEGAAWLINQTLYIQSGKPEHIVIYSVAGNMLYEADIQPGLNTINAAGFPQGVLIIKGGSGWVQKLANP